MTLRGGPTQDEVLAVSLFKAGLRKEDVFADLGCGTGKVSIAVARTCREVHAVDIRAEAITCAKLEAERAGITNIDFYHCKAAEFLKGDPVLDVAFLGGSKGLKETLEELDRLKVRTVVVNAVLIRTLEDAVSTMKKLGTFKEAVQVQVARSYQLAGSIMFKPIDPVFVIVGSREG
ncbi:MAG: methyltransferase domain-containing protein [Methanomassiliicoccales archaeon]|jgi:cobalt-precorrin-6B (C15)-methyltransferase